MEKNYLVTSSSCNQYKTYDEAVNVAKRSAQKHGYDTVRIYELTAVVNTPVPEYEVVKL
jgi:hypothetical protein